MKTPTALNPRAAAFAAACLAIFQRRAIQIMRTTTASENCPMNQNSAPPNKISHFPTSQERTEAIDLVKWVLAVAKLPADSPRFAWYVSRWDVPVKIARAKTDGTFADITANCPPIDPAWCRFVPAALAEWREFRTKYMRPKGEQPQSSTKRRRSV